MRITLLLAMAVGASFVGSNCGGSGVGDPCTPEDEYLTGFSGFSQSEVNVESRSFQCLTRICLVNHFQGRVSCPYGQVEDPDASDSGLATCMGTEAHRNSAECQPGGSLHAASCQVPDRDGSRWEDRIAVPVAAQLVNRQAADAVYCSCRCDGPDPKASYCECPSGFSCEDLVEDLGLGKGQLAGAYCVKSKTQYDPAQPESEECTPGDENCSAKYRYNDGAGQIGRNQKDGACLPAGAVCDSDNRTCCGAIVPVTCVDKAAVDADPNLTQNCNGTGCGPLDHCRESQGDLRPQENCNEANCSGECVSTTCTYASGAVEQMQGPERYDCKKDEVCN